MARFKLNRHMTLILALAACLAASSAFADGSRTETGDDPGLTPPTGSGDPDIPVGPSRSTKGQMQRGSAVVVGTRSTGDERVLRNTWVWRLRVVLTSLRAYYIRF